MNFGEWVKEELRQLNKSQEWLIKRTNISAGSIQRWAKGEQPGLDNYLIICISIARFQSVPVRRVLYRAVKEHPILWRGSKK